MSSYSLPSFAQAFDSLDDRDRTSLPPIHSISHSQSPYLRHDARHEARGPPPPPLQKRESRKRQLERDESSEPSSPRIVKQEQDIDQLEPSPPPPPPAKLQKVRQQLHLNTNLGSTSNNANTTTIAAGSTATTTNSNANTTTTTNVNTHVAPPPPPPSLSRQAPPPSKRRRVTISGVAHPNMHNPALYGAVESAHTPPPHSTNTGPSTPISPVVMGFTIQRDPQAVEQVRAMLAVKQKQKALIESRRGSAAGLSGIEGGRRASNAGISSGEVSGRRASVAAPSVTVNVVNPTPTTATGPGPGTGAAPPLRRTGSSPNGHRLVPTPPTMSPNARANAARTRSPSLLGGARIVSPSPHVVPSQTQNQSQNSRAPPPPPPSLHSNRSPPSHQAHPNAAPNRPHMPSPPQPPAASSSISNTQSQSQPPPPQFVASQGLSALANNLPPPPNSFTRRRAGQLGLRNNKPADLMISPRESESGPAPISNKAPGSALHHPSQSHSLAQLPQRGGIAQLPSVPVSNNYKMLQPSIQSAPPRPGQQPGRFPMALPSLPPVIGAAGSAVQRGTSVRKTTGHVPPTPTRLSMQRAMGTAESASVRLSQPTGLPRVPRTATAASFATPHGPAGMAMPATPATLHRASGADKAAFLAPFEQFYDALSDAQVLKGWFSEQLRRVGTLAKDGEAQVARLRGTDGGLSRSEVESLVRDAVQQEARGLREEVGRLHAQVTELQDELHDLRSGEGRYEAGSAKGRNLTSRSVNGLSPRPPFQPTPPTSNASTYPTAPGVDAYTFPPVQRPQPPLASDSSTGMHAPPPSSNTSAPRRSPSPKRAAPEAMSESASVSGGAESGYGRSASRSGASSPAPSLDSGIGRRVSISAMRFEPQQQRRDAPAPMSGERGRENEKGREKEKGRGSGRPGSKKANSHNGGGTAVGSGSKSQTAAGESNDAPPARRNAGDGGPPTSGAPKHPSSPMDET